MKSTKLAGLSGIIRKIKGLKKRGKLRLEEARGLKYNKSKYSVNTARKWLPHCYRTWSYFRRWDG